MYRVLPFLFLTYSSYQVTGLQGGALLGVAYKMPRRTSTINLGLSGSSGTFEDATVASSKITEAPSNFQLYRYTQTELTLSSCRNVMIILKSNYFNHLLWYLLSFYNTCPIPVVIFCPETWLSLSESQFQERLLFDNMPPCLLYSENHYCSLLSLFSKQACMFGS
jgi:hypothetical protein